MFILNIYLSLRLSTQLLFSHSRYTQIYWLRLSTPFNISSPRSLNLQISAKSTHRAQLDGRENYWLEREIHIAEQMQRREKKGLSSHSRWRLFICRIWKWDWQYRSCLQEKSIIKETGSIYLFLHWSRLSSAFWSGKKRYLHWNIFKYSR